MTPQDGVPTKLTPAERIARATRAQGAWDEFFAPMMGELQSAYTERLVEVANSELSRDKRADKITALSHAIKVLQTLDNGMQAILRDGELAKQDKLRADKIDGMTAPKRRLLSLAPL